MVDDRWPRAEGLWPRDRGPRGRGAEYGDDGICSCVHLASGICHVFICSIQEIRLCRRQISPAPFGYIFNKQCCEILDWMLDI